VRARGLEVFSRCPACPSLIIHAEGAAGSTPSPSRGAYATSAQRTFHADHRAEPSTAVRGAPRREQWRPLPRLLDRPAAAAAAAATRQDGDVDLRACFLSADAVVRHGRTALARLCASARRPRWRPGMPGIHPQAAPVAAAATIVRASGPGGRQHRRSAANCCCCRFSGRIGMI
jgi:hypothetical protein